MLGGDPDVAALEVEHHREPAGTRGREHAPHRRVAIGAVALEAGGLDLDRGGVGRDRLTDHGLVKGLRYVQLNAEALPFPDNSFDAITMAFGLRNVTDKSAALRSMYRILRPGGKVMVLEFSEVQAEWFRPIYDFHSFKVLPKLGELIAGDAHSYRYLAESIRKHPNQAGLKTMMEQAGFEQCAVRNLSGGIVAIHSGYKI
mgnify:CR=1 FL=1